MPEYATQSSEAGVEEQILYPLKTITAERAGAWVAGDVPTLDPADEPEE